MRSVGSLPRRLAYDLPHRDQSQFVTDHERYDEEQMQNSLLRAGALDRVAVDPGAGYDFVFDEEAKIKFMQDMESSIAGNMSLEELELNRKIDEAEKRGPSASSRRMSRSRLNAAHSQVD